MAFTYVVVTDQDNQVGGANALADAVAIMTSYYVRDGVHLRAVDSQTGEAQAFVGIPPVQPDTAPVLRVGVLELADLVYSISVDGVLELAQLDFGDGSTVETVQNLMPVEHAYEASGSYHVTASEGDRSAEALITIFEP